jgi:mono/diheme cytochrome c family protein
MKQFIVISAAVGLTVAACSAVLRPAPACAAEPASPPSGSASTDAAAQIAQGKSLFISYGCGWCHEDGGRKAGRCPQLMNTSRDDAFMISRIVGGSPGRMPAFGEQFKDTDIQAILAYIHNLKPES